MTRRRARLRALLTALVAGALVALPMAAGPIAAATPRRAATPAGPTVLADLRVQATLGLPCVLVQSTAPGSVTLTQRRGGNAIASGTFDGSLGATEVCLTKLRAGDRLLTRRGSARHAARVPEATMKLDRAADVISGQVPPGTAEVTIEARSYLGGWPDGAAANATVDVADDGRFTFDSTGTMDLGRGDLVRATFGDDDRWVLLRQTGAVNVRVGSAAVLGTGPIGGSMTVTLRTAGQALRGVLTRTVRLKPTAAAGTFAGPLRKNGADVPVAAGDVVTASGLPGSFSVPAPSLVVDKAANTVDATCPPHSDWIITKDEDIRSTGTTLTGAVHMDGVAWTTPIPGGRIITVVCQLPSGFGTIEVFIVP